MQKFDRHLMRETDCVDRTRPIVVELGPRWVSIGLKGTREHHLVPWDTILALGRKLDARLITEGK